MNLHLLRDIIEWYIKKRSESVNFWSKRIEIKSREPTSFKSGTTKGRLSLWLTSTIQVYCSRKPSVKLLFLESSRASFKHPLGKKWFIELIGEWNCFKYIEVDSPFESFESIKWFAIEDFQVFLEKHN